MTYGVLSRAGTTLAAVAAITLGAGSANAQDWAEKLSVHGSVNTGYGKSDGLGVFGIDKNGTSDYRAIALQFGYKLDDKSRVVVQLLHRGLGSSPLAKIQPEISPVWAFYERKLGDYTVKLGRNPLPRGIFNEVRFVGTLLPFFRESFYGETLENIDGAVVSRDFDLGGGWGFDANAFAGGFDIKYAIATAQGSIVGEIRAKNAVGSQLWLNTPVDGLRFGAFASSFGTNQVGPATGPAQRIQARHLSVDGDFSRFIARGEWQKFSSGGDAPTDNRLWYAQGGVKLTEKFTVLGEYNATSTLLNFPKPFASLTLKASEDFAGAVNFAPSANVKFKFEVHRQTGYAFDSAVPTIIPPTRPPLVMSIAPKSQSNYGIFSIAVSF
jgi:hypothetical protein